MSTSSNFEIKGAIDPGEKVRTLWMRKRISVDFASIVAGVVFISLAHGLQ